MGMTHAKLRLDAVLSVQSPFGHVVHLLENVSFARVDRRYEFGCRDSARVKAPRGIEVCGALVCAKGIRVASHPTQ
jgi:hypothetical protein